MLRNMACSLIRTLEQNEDDPTRAKVAGRIITTVPKAKELRPFVEKLVTLAKKGRQHELAAAQIKSDVPAKVGNPEGRSEWKQFRDSAEYNPWHTALAPAVACRRRAFSMLRDKRAVSILFEELADRFADRPGGYTRVIKLGRRRGDAAEMAILEWVKDGDTPVRESKKAPKAKAGNTGEPKAETEETAEEVAKDTAEETVAEETAEEEPAATEEEVAEEDAAEKAATEETSEEPEAKSEKSEDEPKADDDKKSE